MNKINLFKLNEIQMDKKQQQLIFGGNLCKCGSCGEYATSEDNRVANRNNNITGTGTNAPILCTCSGADIGNVASAKNG